MDTNDLKRRQVDFGKALQSVALNMLRKANDTRNVKKMITLAEKAADLIVIGLDLEREAEGDKP